MDIHWATSRPGRAAAAAILAAAVAATCSCNGREPPTPVDVEIIDASAVWCSGYDMGSRIRMDVSNRSSQAIRPLYVSVETGADPETGEGEASGVVYFATGGTIPAGSTATLRCGAGSGWDGEPSMDTDDLPLTVTARFERIPDGEEFEVTGTGTLLIEHWWDSCYTWGSDTCYEE